VLNKYIFKNKKYIITDNTITIRRFGPSESSTKKNIAREQRREVKNNIRRDIFFEERGMKEVYRSVGGEVQGLGHKTTLLRSK